MKNTKGKVVIYVKKYCPFCKKAKELLDEKGVKYEEIDVLRNSDLFDGIKSKYNVRTVPQIFITDENGDYVHHIAGCDKLMDLEKEGKLDNMLNNNEDSAGQIKPVKPKRNFLAECMANFIYNFVEKSFLQL